MAQRLAKGIASIRVVLTLSLTGAPVLAHAQGNDRLAPTGGRTALMGNTGIALGEDGASPFMNPATIVRIQDNSFAFSVNFLTFNDLHFTDWHQPANVDTATFGNVALSKSGVSSIGVKALPSTLCIFFTTAGMVAEGELGSYIRETRQKLAFCFATLESQSTNLAALGFNGPTPFGTTSQVQSISENFSRVHAGPTYALVLSDRLALGLSLDGVLTNESFDLESTSITSLAAGGAVQSAFGGSGSGHSFELAAIVGATYRIGRVTFGASAQVPAIHVFGGYTGALHESSAMGTTNSAVLTNGSGSFDAAPPVRFGLGVGARLRHFTLEVDGSFDFGSSTAFSSQLTGTQTTLETAGPQNTPFAATYSVATRPIGNVGGGIEYFVATDLSLIGGVSTNLSSIPGLSPKLTVGNLVPDRANWIAASFGLGSYGRVGSFLIGAVLGFGYGQSLAINPYVLPNNWSVVDTQSYSGMLVLAGSINLKSVTKALNEVQTVVKKGAPPDKATPNSPDIPPPDASPAQTPDASPQPAAPRPAAPVPPSSSVKPPPKTPDGGAP